MAALLVCFNSSFGHLQWLLTSCCIGAAEAAGAVRQQRREAINGGRSGRVATEEMIASTLCAVASALATIHAGTMAFL